MSVWTLGGLVDLYLLVPIHIESRRVSVSNPTAHPDAAWVAQQARNICMDFGDMDHQPTMVMHDADTKFTKQFDEIFESEGIAAKRHTPVSPNLDEFVERWIQSLQQEALDHVVILGEQHLRYIVSEYVKYYHELRPHQGLDNRVPSGSDPPEACGSVGAGDVVCCKRRAA